MGHHGGTVSRMQIEHPHLCPHARRAAPRMCSMAERLLLQQAQELGLCPPALTASDRPAAGEAGSGPGRPPLPFSGIYAVGDNPAADVRGSNLAGPPWVSCLVRTGAWCVVRTCVWRGWMRYMPPLCFAEAHSAGARRCTSLPVTSSQLLQAPPGGRPLNVVHPTCVLCAVGCR